MKFNKLFKMLLGSRKCFWKKIPSPLLSAIYLWLMQFTISRVGAQLSSVFGFSFSFFLVECRVSYGYDGYFQRISFKQKFKCFRGTDMPLAYHFLAYSYYKHIRRQRNHKTEAKLRHTEETRREEEEEEEGRRRVL